MSKLYNVPLECNFFQELVEIVLRAGNVTKVFLPNNRSCREFKQEVSKLNCVAPEIIAISEVLQFPDIRFYLLQFLRSNTFSIPFSTLFDLSESLATLIRNLIFNKADYRKLMIPENFHDSWKSTLLILDQVLENPRIQEFQNHFEMKVNNFFSSISEEKIVVAGLLEENVYNRRLYLQALNSGFVVVSGLENQSGDNFKKIYRLFQDQWHQLEIVNKSRKIANFSNKKLLELPNNSDEALAVALATREIVSQNKSVLIVSSNLVLTQKIKTELLQWNIIADDSSGIALHRTLVGQIISQIIEVIEHEFQNSDVINLLKFNDEIKHDVFELEDFLRKKENYPQNFFRTFELFFQQKKANLAETEFKASEWGDICVDDRNNGEGAPNLFLDGSDKKNFSEANRNENKFSDSVGELAKMFADMQISENEKQSPFEILSAFVGRLETFSKFPTNADFNFWRDYFTDFLNLINISAGEEFAQMLQPQEFENISLFEFCIFLKNHFLSNSLRQNISYTHGVVILGILESQLADADLIIICGANETIWKSSGASDFWMSDSMLRQLNINTIEERNEFYACVWEKLISKSNILVTRSLMENGEQTQCYSRLKNCDIKKDVILEKLMQRVKSPFKFLPISFSAPSPALDFRPTTFWVSDLDLLISNPYVYYAKKILRLKESKPVNARKNLKGNLVHKIFDDFVKKNMNVDKMHALQNLFETICREKFINLEYLGLWYFTVNSIFKFFIDNFNSDSTNFSEIEGHIILKIVHEDKIIQVEIASKADRLEIDTDGNISIIDYKTGEIPSSKKVKDGEKIQLPIEAIIASKNGFKLGKTTVRAMSFWQMKPKEKRIVNVSNTKEEIAEICDNIHAKIKDLLQNYIILEKPYEINLDDKYNKIYMQLARAKEISL